jgi:poly-gamma-glutamate synthesis protein (capsule biosynthesis protein)
VQAAIDETGNPDHPYEEIAPVIQAADFAVGVLNATMSDQVIHTGCVRTYQLVGSPQNADAAARAGFDMMSVATNHIKDCGMMKGWCDETFFDTLFHLKRVGILTVGAGANEDEALQPVVVTLNGVRFGFVALGDSKLTETVFATATNPGIAYLIEENIRRAAQAARQVSDVVIFMPHWGSEDMLLPNWIQRGQARIIASTGVDLVIGTHPHVVQPMQWIDGIPVFYSLGNFIFDQELNINQQGIIVVVRFQGAQFLDYEILPTLVEHDGRVRLADEANTAEILERFEQGSAQLK